MKFFFLLLGTCLASVQSGTAQSGSPRKAAAPAVAPSPVSTPTSLAAPARKPMKVQDVFLLICTDKVRECRDFYTTHFGFTTAFESSIYTQLTVESETGGAFSLAFMPPTNPFGPTFQAAYSGRGAYVTIQVAHAAEVFETIRKAGAPIVQPVRDEAWGQRHFVTQDPHGTIVDVVESIAVVPGFYDKYQVR